MESSSPVSVLCIYRVREDQSDAFMPLLEKHWSTLDSVGLVSEQPARWYRGEDKDKRRCFIEMFEWKNAEAPNVAHQMPEVMAIWEPMGALVDDMEFIDIEPLG